MEKMHSDIRVLWVREVVVHIHKEETGMRLTTFWM